MSESIDTNSIKKKRKVIWLIWFLPVVALLISSWMVFKHLNEQAEEITVYFDSADGFIEDKTPLKYKGIKVGIISNINVNETNLNEFIVTIKVNKRVKSVIAKEGTKFWKVEPKVSLTEITGLNTILSGVYIDLLLSSDNIKDINNYKSKTVFKAINERPVNLLKNKGIFLTLSSQKGSLSVGSPILYKSFIVGKILKKSLEDKNIIYTIFIQNKYKNLIKENTVFWNISGFDLKASLSGIKLRVENLATLVAGGITFDSNDNTKLLINSNKIFKLYDSKEDVIFNDKLITLTLKSKKGINENLTQVLHNDIVIGKVTNSKFLSTNNCTEVTILLKKDFMHLLEYEPYFHIVKPKLSLEKFKEITDVLKDDYINLTKQSKKKGEPLYSFTLYTKAKKISMYSIVLKTNDSIKVSKESPVYFKDIKVGKVSYKKLQKKSDTVIIGLDIFWKYRYLVNDSSLFYLESPIEFHASLSEINIKTAPLKSFIKAGVSFDTPNLKEKSTTKHFELFNSYKNMLDERYLQAKGSRFKIEIDKLTSINKNDFIYYKGIEAGKIIGNKYNKKSQKIDIELFIFKEFADLINTSTRFYSVGGIDIDISLDKVNIKTRSLDTLIKGAISFVTLDTTAKKADIRHRFKYFKNLDEAQEKYIHASIFMKKGFNLKKGSKILYKDITIGKIKDLKFTKDDNVIAAIDILKTHSKLLNKDTIFYLDDFKFGITKIENPSAALLGPRISIIAGKSDIGKRDFTLITYKPMQEFDKNGLRVVVNSKTKSSLKQNSPVYYRQLQIGVVEKYTLSKDSTKVKLQLLIEEKYEHLVRDNSIFYNAGALGVDFYLFGVKIKTETLETLISGGISMVTPTKYGNKAKRMNEFKLYSDLEDEWLEWNPKISK